MQERAEHQEQVRMLGSDRLAQMSLQQAQQRIQQTEQNQAQLARIGVRLSEGYKTKMARKYVADPAGSEERMRLAQEKRDKKAQRRQGR